MLNRILNGWQDGKKIRVYIVKVVSLFMRLIGKAGKGGILFLGGGARCLDARLILV